MTKKELESHKIAMMKELAKLETFGFSDKANAQVFPYVVIETIALLKNSVFVPNPVDYTSTSDGAEALLREFGETNE